MPSPRKTINSAARCLRSCSRQPCVFPHTFEGVDGHRHLLKIELDTVLDTQCLCCSKEEGRCRLVSHMHTSEYGVVDCRPAMSMERGSISTQTGGFNESFNAHRPLQKPRRKSTTHRLVDLIHTSNSFPPLQEEKSYWSGCIDSGSTP